MIFRLNQNFNKIQQIFCFIVVTLSLFPCYAQDNSSEDILTIQNNANKLSRQWSEDSFRRAAGLFEEASDKWFEINELDNSAECLRESAQLHIILAQNEKAKSLLDRAFELDETSNNSSGMAKTLSYLSHLLTTEGNFEEGLAKVNSALELSKFSSDSFSQALSMYALAEIQYSQSPPEIALKSYLEAREFAKQANDAKLSARILLGLSYAYVKNGNPGAALKSAQESFSKWIETNDQRGQAISRICIGLAYKMSGEMQNALNAYSLAEKMFPGNVDFIEHARLLNAIGTIFTDYNYTQLAEKYYYSAYLLFKKAVYPRGQLATLPTLIEISLSNEKLEEAEIYYRDLETLSKKLNNDFFLGYTQIILGNDKLRRNQNEEAIEFYNSALKFAEKYKNKVYYAVIYQRLGEANKKLGFYKHSRDYLTSSLHTFQNVANKPLESEALFQIAETDFLENEPENALRLIQRSINLTETLYSNVANSNLRRAYFSNVYDRYELYIHLLMQKRRQSPDEDFAIQALQASEKSRSRSMLETLRLSEANFFKDADPESLKREKEIRSLLNVRADKLTELLSGGAGKTEIEKIEDEIRLLENELEEIKATLKQKNPVYSALANPLPFDVAEFQQNVLDDKTALLEFSLGEKESYLWMIGKNEFNFYILPPRKIIEDRIKKILQTFESRQILPNEENEGYQKRIAESDDSFNQEAKILSNELLGQIAEKIAGKRLIIVPDGKLHYLPLSALPLPDSDELLIRQNEIVYAPSASILLLTAKIRTQSSPEKDLLIFADPVFSDADNRLTAKSETENSLPAIFSLNLRDFRLMDGNGKLPRLFASQDEAVSIQTAVGQSQTIIVNGFEANRDRVLNSDISDYRILHFATHGLIDAERPEISAIVLSQFDEYGNKREGFLRLQDIYSLQLNSDLVVLSTCQSGFGREIKGEGLMSLNNAFLQAGAKSVVSSAWKVDDYATAELMKYFYQELTAQQLTPAEALRRAQLKMRGNPQFSSPFYWAAFTVQGDFRHPVLIGNSNNLYYLVFVFFAVLILGIFWKFKISRR